jgi:FtsZ-interacting cell division protein ZipA
MILGLIAGAALLVSGLFTWHAKSKKSDAQETPMENTFSSRIRQHFDDLFRDNLVEQLRTDVLYARADTERVRQDKDQVIADLRSEKAQLLARIAMYDAKAGLRPVNETPKKPSFGADFQIPLPKSQWQILQERREAEIAKELEEEKKEQEPVATAT